MQNFYTSKSKYLLALHSCSESLGIAVKDVANNESKLKSKTFNIGRALSNNLFKCLEIVLPRKLWKQIIRISVAKGPGGFTSTRLTLSMARTICQQIDCSLDSLSTFQLMAPRLIKDLNSYQIFDPFWIKDKLPRRGIIAGKYQLVKIHQESNFHEFNEIVSPQLIKNEKDLNPAFDAIYDIEKDTNSLIEFSQFCHNSKVKSYWYKTLPIYPTSPIDNKKSLNTNKFKP